MLPFCKLCAARARRAATLVSAVCAIFGAAAACAIAIYLSSKDTGMIASLAVFGAVIGGLLGSIPARYFRPVYLSRFKRERNTVRIHFKNHQYAQLMREEGRVV